MLSGLKKIQLEAALLSHPAVQEAAVVVESLVEQSLGVEQSFGKSVGQCVEARGRQPLTQKPQREKSQSNISAFVTLEQGHQANSQLVDDLKQSVDQLKGISAAIEEIHFLDSLPRTVSGKMDFQKLKTFALR